MLKKFLNLFDSEKESDKQKEETNKNSSQEELIVADIEVETEEESDNEWADSERGQKAAVELDPNTLHGTNYTVEEFDAEVERIVQKFIKEDEAENNKVSESDIRNYYINVRRQVYQKWTGANTNMMLQWEQVNQMEHLGVTSFGNAKHDNSNPLLDPIHGISLEDYAAISYFLASGSDLNTILSKLGIDMVIYQEVSTIWAKRMQEDTTFQVATLFSQYYGTSDKHPKLSGAAVELSEKGKSTLEKMKNDRFFYEELCGARSAAYEYGLDGSQWIMDNYHVSLGEFQKIATFHMEQDQKHVDMEMTLKYTRHMQNKMEEYKKIFAQEQGGNIADDIQF